MMDFKPTVMNLGSGDWWIYGEDDLYFYHFYGWIPQYYSIKKVDTNKCQDFESNNFDSWCIEYVEKHE